MTTLLAALALVQPAPFAAVDAAAAAAVQRGDAPGVVVVVVHDGRVVLRNAHGVARPDRPDEPLRADAVFDLASLTKPVATAASVHLLIERGKLRLDDPAAKHWPAFAANGKDAVTVEHLLVHTSGLTADNALADYADGRGKALERVAALKLEAEPGKRFRYSDVGFIVLGELVERVSGEPLDVFARKNLFEPLGMADTGYRPAAAGRVVATAKRADGWLAGTVHDPRAARMGGVAGHAGLFGTADDLARFARMLLAGGELDGRRVLSAESVKRFAEPVAVPGGLRSRGWDVDTGFSSPRGDGFAKGAGYGHTGFTGTSVWIDPPSKTAVIVLTSRLQLGEKASVTRLRKEAGTAAAAAGK